MNCVCVNLLVRKKPIKIKENLIGPVMISAKLKNNVILGRDEI